MAILEKILFQKRHGDATPTKSKMNAECWRLELSNQKRALKGCLGLPSLKPTEHLEIDVWNTSFLLGWPIFRGYVRFRECNIWDEILPSYVPLPRCFTSPPRQVLPVVSVAECAVDKLTWGPGESLIHARHLGNELWEKDKSKIWGWGETRTALAATAARTTV